MKATAQASQTQREGHHFLPDFCAVATLLPLILVAQLLVLVLELMRQPLPAFDWPHFGLMSFYVQWLVLLSAASLCQLRPLLQRWPAAQSAMVSYLLVLVWSVLIGIAAQWLLAMGIDTIDFYWLGRDVLIAAVLAGIAMRYYYLQSQLRWRRQAEANARIDALQARIRPHFLFNSLNSIASLIAIDGQRAEQAVEDLADLFRASLQQRDELGTWAEERELCQRYLAIEQLRLGDRLRLDWQVEGMQESTPIPPLTLQPLLENAIYHGIQQLPEGGAITISGQTVKRGQHHQVTITVSNPMAENALARSGNRLATANIRHRLQALFGESAYLSLHRGEHAFKAELGYPIALSHSRVTGAEVAASQGEIDD